jgi:hypothetical protein
MTISGILAVTKDRNVFFWRGELVLNSMQSACGRLRWSDSPTAAQCSLEGFRSIIGPLSARRSAEGRFQYQIAMVELRPTLEDSVYVFDRDTIISWGAVGQRVRLADGMPLHEPKPVGRPLALLQHPRCWLEEVGGVVYRAWTSLEPPAIPVGLQLNGRTDPGQFICLFPGPRFILAVRHGHSPLAFACACRIPKP